MKILRYKLGDCEWPILKHKPHTMKLSGVEYSKGDLNIVDDRAAIWKGTTLLLGEPLQRTFYYLDERLVAKAEFHKYLHTTKQQSETSILNH